METNTETMYRVSIIFDGAVDQDETFDNFNEAQKFYDRNLADLRENYRNSEWAVTEGIEHYYEYEGMSETEWLTSVEYHPEYGEHFRYY